MIEIWRDIKDYEGLYEVSNWGESQVTQEKGLEGILLVYDT